MTESASPQEQPKPHIQFFNEYGIHDTKGGVSLVSTPNWQTALRDVTSQDFGNSIVLLPELITIAGRDLTSVYDYQQDVEKALAEFSEFTKTQPNATFVVGSPHYAKESSKPYNGAFVFKNGNIETVIHKKASSLGESRYFAMDLSQPPSVVGDANLLICKDLCGATITEQDVQYKKYVLGAKKDPLIDQISKRNFIDPNIRRLLVISCWGIGMNPLLRDQKFDTQDKINSYYQQTLEYAIEEAFRENPSLQQIVVCDRAPTSPKAILNRTATNPMSLMAHR